MDIKHDKEFQDLNGHDVPGNAFTLMMLCDRIGEIAMQVGHCYDPFEIPLQLAGTHLLFTLQPRSTGFEVARCRVFYISACRWGGWVPVSEASMLH